MIDPNMVRDFLAQHRIAVVGVSAASSSFGNTIYRELRSRGYDVVAVNRSTDTAEGDPCYPDVLSVPGTLDGVIVMVKASSAEQVLRDCAERGVKRVWLFRGLGGPGALSKETEALAQELGLEVIPGACPLMFLEPVKGAHRFHRAMRRMNGSLAKAS